MQSDRKMTESNVSQQIANEFKNLPANKKIVIENNKLMFAYTGVGSGAQGISANGRQVIELLLAHVQKSVAAGNPDIALLDKCRVHPWTKQVLQNNPDLMGKLNTVENEYIKELGNILQADSRAVFLTVEEDILLDPTHSNSSQRNADFVDNTANKLAAIVIQEPNIDYRAQQLNRYMKLFSDQLNRNNFMGAKIIKAAIENPYLNRMVATYDSVSENTRKTFEAERELLTPMRNYKNIREKYIELEKNQKTFIPFTGNLQTDITFNKEGNALNGSYAASVIKATDNAIKEKYADIVHATYDLKKPEKSLAEISLAELELSHLTLSVAEKKAAEVEAVKSMPGGKKVFNTITFVQEGLQKTPMAAPTSFANYMANYKAEYDEKKVSEMSYKLEPKRTEDQAPNSRSQVFVEDKQNLSQTLGRFASKVNQFVDATKKVKNMQAILHRNQDRPTRTKEEVQELINAQKNQRLTASPAGTSTATQNSLEPQPEEKSRFSLRRS